MSTTRDAILGALDLPTETIEVPEWGNIKVNIRGMSGLERDDFDKLLVPGDISGMRARLAAVSVCDEHGELLFTMEDVPALSKKSAKALDRIAAVAARLNGMSKPDDAEGN